MEFIFFILFLNFPTSKLAESYAVLIVEITGGSRDLKLLGRGKMEPMLRDRTFPHLTST